MREGKVLITAGHSHIRKLDAATGKASDHHLL